MHQPSTANRSILIIFGAVLVIAAGGLLTGYFLGVKDAVANNHHGETVGERPTDDTALAAVRDKTQAFLATPLVVTVGDQRVELRWENLGASVDEPSVALARLDEAGELSGVYPVALDATKARETLTSLKGELDRPAADAWLDLEGREVVAAHEGVVLDVLGSAEVLEAAARMGKSEVELAATHTLPEKTDLGIDNISTVLASFSTKYKVSDSRRNDNLKLLASRIDGHVMQPGEVFSFNDLSGARTEKEGYKMAHVIMKGEMVDGMAGGACQISTTLHGAAFFAGIEIVNSIPHSRPSTYVTLGLDATVVYPTTDLKLRNNYDFPVVIHYKVARGVSEVEILGKTKPFDEIKFERSVQKRIPFETITREDNGIGVGHMVVDQKGEYGFKVKRYRKVLKDGKVLKTDSWDLKYTPVVEYVRMGINPDPNLPAPKPRRGH